MIKTNPGVKKGLPSQTPWSPAQCGLFYGLYAIALAIFFMMTQKVWVNTFRSMSTLMTPTFLEKTLGAPYVLPIIPALIAATIVLIMFFLDEKHVRHGHIPTHTPSRAFWFHGLVIFFGVALVFEVTWILKDVITGQYTHDGQTDLGFLTIFTVILATMSTGILWAQKIAQHPAQSEGWFLALWAMMVVSVMGLAFHVFSPKQIHQAYKDIDYAKVLNMELGEKLCGEQLSTIMAQTPVPQTVYISKSGKRLSDTAKKGFLPVTFKVTGPKSCQFCHKGTSSNILRFILFPHVSHASAGGWCVIFHNVAPKKKDTPPPTKEPGPQKNNA